MDRDDADESEYDASIPIPEILPKSVQDVWARKKRRQQSVKAANQMWQPILEHYRAYSENLTFVPWSDR